jgi:hypothetical protein
VAKSTDRPRFERFLEAVYNYWPNFLSNVATVMLAVAAIWFSLQPKGHWIIGPILILVLAALLSFVTEWKIYSRTGKLSNLERRNTALEYSNEELEGMLRSLFREQLRLLAHKIGFSDSERISAYRYDRDIDAFRLVSRFSQNPTLNGPGRSEYPADEGCIAKAWQTGEAVALLPDKRTDETAYFAKLEADWGIPRAVAEQLTMVSRHMVGFALEDERGDYIAVLIFETSRETPLDLQKIKKEMTTESKRLSVFVQESEQIGKQRLELARRAGF